MQNLFNVYAGWYDFHTPPDHYIHDHALVLKLAANYGSTARLLDVGCGTGVLVEKAQSAGFEAMGLDASAQMIEVAQTRVRVGSVRVQYMQSLEDVEQYDLVVSLSWCVHYCASVEEMAHTIAGFRRALSTGGRLLLQVAHGANLNTDWLEDREIGPTGHVDDVSLRFRFRPDSRQSHSLLADYDFRCKSTREEFYETHHLNVTDAYQVAELMKAAGFEAVEIWNSWRQDSFVDGGSVYVTGRRF